MIILNILNLMENTRDIAQTTPDLLALPPPDGGFPQGLVIVLALLAGLAFWLHKRRPQG